LIGVSPAAVAGCFFTGFANGAFWALAPLYGRSAGFSLTEVALFMTLAVLGGAAIQWPIGYLSDRVGRRPLLVVTGALGALAGVVLNVLSTSSPMAIYPFAVLWGCCAFPIYTLCVAHANDLRSEEHTSELHS